MRTTIDTRKPEAPARKSSYEPQPWQQFTLRNGEFVAPRTATRKEAWKR